MDALVTRLRKYQQERAFLKETEDKIKSLMHEILSNK